jgi:hypothetical protein
MKDLTLIFVCSLALSFFGDFGLANAQGPPITRAYRFLIPEGYVGWVRVDFDVPGAPELPVDDGFYIFKFQKSGRLQTSSSDNRISRYNEYYYYSDTTKYKLDIDSTRPNYTILEEFSGPGPMNDVPIPYHYRYALIGPRSLLRDYRSTSGKIAPKEKDSLPKVGAIIWLTEKQLTDLNVKQL